MNGLERFGASKHEKVKHLKRLQEIPIKDALRIIAANEHENTSNKAQKNGTKSKMDAQI